MLPIGGNILAAVSGGKDSVYLLKTLMELAPERKLKISCAHFDHRLRGWESDRDREFVLSLCEEWGVPCRAGSGDVAGFAQREGLGVEEAARVLRYEFLEKTASELGADRIATAHTADDNLETMLMNLLRGSGLRGLCGIPPVRGRIVRPLLEISSAEIIHKLRAEGIPWVEDSTNGEDICTRNRVRHSLIPLLRELNPSVDEAAVRCAALLRQDEEYLSALASDFLSGQSEGISVKALNALPPPVASRALMLAAGGSLSQAHVEALLKLAESPDPHAQACIPGVTARREYDRLIFGGQAPPKPETRPLIPGRTLRFEELGLELRSRYEPKAVEINNSDNTFFIRSDKICGELTVGSAQGGDRIRLPGRGCTKTVKNLFAEAKLTPSRRAACLAVRDRAGLLALGGFGVDERCLARPGDDALIIEIHPIKIDN